MKDEREEAGRAEAAEAAARINELIASHGEWLYSEGVEGRAISLRKSECEAGVSHGHLIFSCWSDHGSRIWRIEGWKWTGERLQLEAQRRTGALRCTLELVPRASASRALLTISDNRRVLCERLAQLAREHLNGERIERAGLSAGTRPGQPGRYARIILRRGMRERLAVTGIVAGSREGETEALLSSTLIWYSRLRDSAIGPTICHLCLLLEAPLAEAVEERVALLNESLRRVIRLYLLDDDWQELVRVKSRTREELWQEKPPRLHVIAEKPLSEPAARIIAHAPDAIDAIRARHGETLRFHGLPFARVRRVMNREWVWFGTHGTRQLLDESTRPAWLSLLDEL